MRVFLLCFMLGISFCFSNNSYSQSTKLSLNLKNKTIKQVFSEIEKNSEFIFFYQDDILDVNRKVTVNADNGTVEQILNEVLSATGNTYFVSDRSIYITKKDPDNTVHEEAVVQQEKKTITGTITDKEGEAVIGANIIEKGTTNGTVTDIEGEFTLSVENDAVLQISCIGYLSQEINTIGKIMINAVLQEDTKVLDELIVVGYGTMKKRDLTGAVSSIKMSDQSINTMPSIGQSLAGKAAGLDINQTSGQPGAKMNFRIRGAGSITANNDPLIIIDGFPVSDPGNLGSGNRYSNGTRDNILASINPNDVESIEVLKDASSTAIYGARAGHGVIIITTKRGHERAASVRYSGSASIQSITTGYKLLNAQEYMNESNRYMYEKWMINNNLYPYGTRQIDDNTSLFIPKFTPEEVANPRYNTNWIDAVTRTGFQTQHNMSISGGTGNTQYLISGNYMKQEGVMRNNEMERFTTRINLDQRLNRFIKMGVSIHVSRNEFSDVALGDAATENAGLISAAISYNPLIPIKNENGDFSNNPESVPVPNPVSLLDITDNTRKERFLGNVFVEVEPIKELKLKVNLGIDRNHQKRKTYLPKTTLYGSKMNGQASISQSDRSDYLFEFTTSYNKKLGVHNINAVVGHSYQTFNNEWLTLGNNDFIIDSFIFNNMGAGNAQKPTVGSSAFVDKMASFFGRVNYSLYDKYLLTATLRADGSSSFGTNNRWGYFPSLALGWRISEENFWEPFKEVVSNVKLRASYGETGNASVGPYAMSYYSVGYNTIWGDSEYKGVYLSQLGNSDLKWETTSEWNFGIDLGFFDNRFNLVGEFYTRTISDLLNIRNLMSYYEVPSIMANVGSTESKGLELTINTENIKTKDFRWNTDFTFSFYRDKWKERAESWKPSAYNEYNESLRMYYGYLSDGIIQAGDVVSHMPGALPGQIKIKDVDGFLFDKDGNIVVDQYGKALKTGKPDGKLNEADMVVYGSQDPGYLIGFNNTFKYKNFDLNFYMYGQFDRLINGDFYNQIAGLDGYAYGSNYPRTVKDAWAHNNTGGKVPGVSQALSAYGVGDSYFYKMWFLRMRNITLGYTLPKSKIYSNLRIYFDVNNPFILTNYNGFDPETDQNYYAYPNIRSFNIGVEISF